MTSPGLLVAVLLLLAVLPWALARRVPESPRPPRRRVPRHPVPLDVAVLLDLADAALDAGASVPGALQALGRAVAPPAGGRGTAGQLGPQLEAAGTALLLGATWEEAWQDAPASLAPLADALAPAWVDGAAPGPLLRQAAASLRAGRHRQAQEAAARMGVRLVLPLGLCFLPAFVLLGVVPVVLAAGGDLLGR